MSNVKNKNTFRSLGKQQCLDSYELVRQNARKHFAAAQMLASGHDFANGVAHLILGTEELIKSMMLMLQGYDFPVRNIKNYDKLFYNHITRHNLLKECYSIYLFAYGVVEGRPGRKPTQSRAEYWVALFMSGLEAAKKGVENYEWWDNADKLKQNCFYVDYTSAGFVRPSDITEQDWQRAYKFVSTFTVDLNEMMVKIANAPTIKLAEYKKDFDAAELNELLGESINRKRATI